MAILTGRPAFDLARVNAYTAAKQHLHPEYPGEGVVQTTRDLAALHSTGAAVPYLSLWARIPAFAREDLNRETYDQRSLARLVCMRNTLFVVPGDDFARFQVAFAAPLRTATTRLLEALVVQAGLCPPERAGITLARLQDEVMQALAPDRALTVEQIGALVPELRARVEYGVGRAYTAQLSIGARLVPGMCAFGKLVRARPRGTWRGNLWRYTPLATWLPGVDLNGVDAPEARAWLVRQYLRAFGPATAADAQWWTGLAKGEITRALAATGDAVATVAVEGFDEGFLMLAEDADRLARSSVPREPYVSLLPALDPYIMGYRDRRRFLDPERKAAVFDYAGNARPSVWAGGRVVGAWREEKRGRPVFDLFATLSAAENALLAVRIERLTDFLNSDR